MTAKSIRTYKKEEEKTINYPVKLTTVVWVAQQCKREDNHMKEKEITVRVKLG